MKKVFLFCVVALAFASCAPKAAETTPSTDSITSTVDSTSVDSTATDTTATDSVAK